MQVSLIKEYTKTICLSFVTSIVYPFPKCISMFRLIFLSNLSELHRCCLKGIREKKAKERDNEFKKFNSRNKHCC